MVNLLLRGCSLRNVDYVIGVVVYTGHDSKIMMNSVKAKTKTSKLENKMNG
jgi:phospholipid-transporting ATPase